MRDSRQPSSRRSTAKHIRDHRLQLDRRLFEVVSTFGYLSEAPSSSAGGIRGLGAGFEI